jgi:hypothetical protein
MQKRGQRYKDLLQALRTTLREMCQDHGVINLDVQDRVEGKPEYFLDQFHLSEEGRFAFSKMIVEKLIDSGLIPPPTGGEESVNTMVNN